MHMGTSHSFLVFIPSLNLFFSPLILLPVFDESCFLVVRLISFSMLFFKFWESLEQAGEENTSLLTNFCITSGGDVTIKPLTSRVHNNYNNQSSFSQDWPGFKHPPCTGIHINCLANINLPPSKVHGFFKCKKVSNAQCGSSMPPLARECVAPRYPAPRWTS